MDGNPFTTTYPRQPGARDEAIAASWCPALGTLPALALALNECRLDLTAGEVAIRLGYRSAVNLSRALPRLGLPSFRPLRNWCCVIGLLQRSRHPDWSMMRHAVRCGTEPSAYYRLVRRTTGRTWSEVRALGEEWVVRAAMREWGRTTSKKPLNLESITRNQPRRRSNAHAGQNA